MIIGFDIDGTVSSLDIGKLEAIRGIQDPEVRLNEEKLYYLSCGVCLDPRKFLNPLSDTAVFVTSRPKRVTKATLYWLNYNFPGLPVRLPVVFTEDFGAKPTADAWVNVKTPADAVAVLRSGAEAKAQAIRYVGASVYFEDTGEVVQELRRLLPEVTVVQYGGARPAWKVLSPEGVGK